MTINDQTTEFDRWLEKRYDAGKPPAEMLDVMKDLADTLHGAWLAVQCEFGEKAQPEHALALLGLVLSERKSAGSTQQAGVVGRRS